MLTTRREFLLGSGALLAGCQSAPQQQPSAASASAESLDALLAAHAKVWPEKPGAGANHDPMAAEVLETLGRAAAIPARWVDRAPSYAGPELRGRALAEWTSALGDYERYGDWLALFERELAADTWRNVLARWAPRLAPGLSGALFHGLLRTAHAARSLRRAETPERRRELACGLAYWAARARPLPVRSGERRSRLGLADLETPWSADASDVPFDAVMQRLHAQPLAPEIVLDTPAHVPAEQIQAIAREAAEAFLEMIVQRRQTIWLLHTVTGPAAIELLLPELDEASAALLVAYAQQAVVALFRAYGAPFVRRASLQKEAPPRASWTELVDRAAALQSVHSLKLFEALMRIEEPGDPLYRTIAERWLAS
jgi:hypothetical protein